MEIKNTSQELFIEVLKTLALPPKHVELTFAYKGLDLHGGVYEGVPGKSRYLSECKKQGAVPMSVTFVYDHNENIFLPKKSAPDVLFADTDNFKNKIAKTVNGCIIKGGKMHTLSFEVKNPAKKGLETFLETELVKLLEQKYQFSEVDIVFSYSDKDCVKPDTNLLYLGRDSLGLGIGHGLEIKDALKLSKWFGKLQKKYEK